VKYLAAFGASVLLVFLLAKLIGIFALFIGIFGFLAACTLMLKPSPRPAPDEVPLGGALVASLLLGAAAVPLMRRSGETVREWHERNEQTVGNAVVDTVDLAITGVELGADYVGNVIDYLTDD
jgi:hypothetical protein